MRVAAPRIVAGTVRPSVVWSSGTVGQFLSQHLGQHVVVGANPDRKVLHVGVSHGRVRVLGHHRQSRAGRSQTGFGAGKVEFLHHPIDPERKKRTGPVHELAQQLRIALCELIGVLAGGQVDHTDLER